MQRNMFSISKSIMTPEKMMPCTPELLNAAMDDAKVAETCKQIASHLEEVKNGTLAREAFKKMKYKLKAQNLPVVCFHALFSDGYRHNESAVPSGLSIYDVDHLEIDPRTYYHTKVAGREVELGISLAHVSPSNEGVRLVFPEGWALLRLSLHDPQMPLNIESRKAGGAKEIAQQVQELLAGFDALDFSVFNK